jgi:hypothetical protein
MEIMYSVFADAVTRERFGELVANSPKTFITKGQGDYLLTLVYFKIIKSFVNKFLSRPILGMCGSW